jgi:hypothetical protein
VCKVLYSPAAGSLCLAFLLNMAPSESLGRSEGGTEDNVMGDGIS